MLAQKTILKAVPNVMKTVDVPKLREKKQGEVRDTYFHGEKSPMTYKDAGVDVETGDRSSKQSAVQAKNTFGPDVMQFKGINGLSAMFNNYEDPYLLGATDGVGTKIKVAFATGKHDTVGVDLVAMCVNDLVRRGAVPLMFFPYFAMHTIDPAVTEALMSGVVEGCKQAGCAILGGETAEMGDLYGAGEYDLAGNAVGVVERSKLIDGSRIETDDVILGIPSNGLHSNGISLARKVLLSEYDVKDKPVELGGKTVGETLLTPTRIYVQDILGLLRAGVDLHGVAHITGGGLPSKLGSIVPAELTAKLNKENWKCPEVFKLIQKLGKVEEAEMYKTFNMGIGMVLVVNSHDALTVKSTLSDVMEIGRVFNREKSVVIE